MKHCKKSVAAGNELSLKLLHQKQLSIVFFKKFNFLSATPTIMCLVLFVLNALKVKCAQLL